MAQMRRGNLPAEVTSFVGRRAVLGPLRRILENHRAVTITGAGGVGKTRLALRVAAEVSRAFPDGVWLVELDDVDQEAVASTTLSALGRAQDSGSSPHGTLVEQMRPMKALLVLDGCERVVEATAELVTHLLRSAPDLRVIATSRRPLHIAGEAVLPIHGLSVPDPEQGNLPATAVRHFDAVALFADRAAAIRPDFALTDATVGRVASICRRLDGLPIAIEFAADRLDVLSLEQLAERLDSAYPLLGTSRRAGPKRQRTLQSVADSSYALCTPEERVLLPRLAVFSGRFPLDAVGVVCAGGPVDERSVLELVAGLVDKSVLRRDEHPGGSWYRLPGLLRDYARHHLTESDEWTVLQERHAQWCLELAQQAAPGLMTTKTDSWLGRIRGNHDNLRSAFEFCLDHHADLALRLAAALWDHWVVDDRVAEGRSWLDRALTAGADPSPERVYAIAVAAFLAIADNDEEAAGAQLREGLTLQMRFADSAPTAYLHVVNGLHSIQRGDLTSARPELEAALEMLRAVNDVMGISRTLWVLAAMCVWTGDAAGGLAYANEFHQMTEAADDSWGRAFVYWTVALAQMQIGDSDAALAAQRSFATLVHRLDDHLGMTWCIQSGALVFAAAGRAEEAAVLLGAGDANPAFILPTVEGVRERCAARVRSELGIRRFDELAAKGRRISLGEAVELMADRPCEVEAPPAEGGVPALSKREWEVAALIAAGRSNKEIAAALVISTRTAEGHVRRILNKLDCLSRAQVAVWMAEHRAIHGADQTLVATR